MITAEQMHEACDKEWNENYSHGGYCHEQSFRWGFQEGTMYTEQEVLNKIHEWLADKLPTEMGFVDANIVLCDFCKDFNITQEHD